MDVLDPQAIEKLVGERTVEYLKMLMKTIEHHMRGLIANENLGGEKLNLNLEFSAQVIALLAASRYVALQVPEEIHLQLLHRADHLVNDLMTQFNLNQRTMHHEPAPAPEPIVVSKPKNPIKA